MTGRVARSARPTRTRSRLSVGASRRRSMRPAHKGLVHHGMVPLVFLTRALGGRHLLRSTPHACSEFSGEIRTRDGAECDFGLRDRRRRCAAGRSRPGPDQGCRLRHRLRRCAGGAGRLPGEADLAAHARAGDRRHGLGGRQRRRRAFRSATVSWRRRRAASPSTPSPSATACSAFPTASPSPVRRACGSTTSPRCTACAIAPTCRRASACWCWAPRAASASPPCRSASFWAPRSSPWPRPRRSGPSRGAGGADRVLDSAVEGWRERLKDSLQRRRAGRDLRSVVRAIVRAGLPLARLARAASRRRLRRWRDPAAARQPPADEGSGPGRRRRPPVRAVRTREGRRLREGADRVGGRGAACSLAGRQFAFSDFAEAMAWAQSGRGMGKTILEIA